MRTIQLLTVFSLFLLVPASITRAQNISSQKGLTTASFPTQYGNVKIYLPDDIRQGETISGTVVAEPKGNKARQTEKNLAGLSKFSVSINGNKFIVSSKPAVFKCTLPPNITSPVPIDMVDPGGNRAQLIVPLKTMNTPEISEGCGIPSHALVGEPARISGNFDGDASNTKCSLNNQPTQILAESPRQCIIIVQSDRGPIRTFDVQVNEKGQQKCSRQMSGVDMHVTTGGLKLRKGQSTFIDVKLTGLQNLPDKAVLTIVNTTPNVVTMTNGNIQVVPIPPLPDSAQGTFSIHCPAVSITTGNFVVEINLDLPQPGETIDQNPPTQPKLPGKDSMPTTIAIENYKKAAAEYYKQYGSKQ